MSVSPDISLALEIGQPLVTPLTAGIVVMVLIIFFFALLSIISYFPVLLSLTSYIHSVARIKARGVLYIQYEPAFDLIQSGSVTDCLGRLKQAGYLSDVRVETSLEEIEEELLIAWSSELAQMELDAPHDAAVLFAAYHHLHELYKVKRILRLVYGRMGERVMAHPSLLPRDISEDLAAKMASLTSVSECIRLMGHTWYGKALISALPLCDAKNSLYDIEHALDCIGFSELVSRMNLVQSYLPTLYRTFISVLIDIQNVKTLIRAKHGGWSQDDVRLCLVSGGQYLPAWQIARLNEMMSLPDLISQLAGTRFDPYLTPEMREYPTPTSLMRLDIALDRMLLDTVYRLGLEYYHSGGPLVKYLVSKEYELRNIRVILSGIAEELDAEIISRMVVFEPEMA